MENLIKASDFMKQLKNEGLVIVSIAELQKISNIEIHRKRKDLLSKKLLTIREVLELELLPVKTRTTIERWINEGVFLKTEVSRNNKNQIVILKKALNRLGYVE